MKGEVRERERGKVGRGGAQTSAKSGRSPRGSSTTLAYRFVSCVLSYIEVGYSGTAAADGGGKWVNVGLCGRVKVTVNLLV